MEGPWGSGRTEGVEVGREQMLKGIVNPGLESAGETLNDFKDFEAE